MGALPIGRPNQFGILAEPGSRLVADAGANALLRVAANGTVETVAVFPLLPNPIPVGPPMVEAVPTAVARGPDGTLYVGQATGFPFAPGVANVYRVVPGQNPVIHCHVTNNGVTRLHWAPLGLAARAAQAGTTAASHRAGWHIEPVHRCAG